ncbi:tail fiber protein [Salmonella enterica]|nr:tail fiber protein [Salmonella enterica]
MSSDSVVISSVSYPDPTTLPLVADIQYHEPYVSAGLNRKLRGILKEGFYSGFLPRLGGGLTLVITSEDAENKTGSASVNIGDDYQITIRQQKDVTLQLSAGTKFAIVLKGVYTLGSDTYQVNSKSTIQAAEINAKTYTDSYALGDGELLICTVNVPAGATELTDDMIDSTDKKDAAIGIELSNDYESQEEKKAATPKAVSDGIAAHEGKPNPHPQYLQSENLLSEIADAGEEAIAEAQKNIGLEFSDSFDSDDQKVAATPKAVKDGIEDHEGKENPHRQYLRIANCLIEIAEQGEEARQKVLDNLRLGEGSALPVGVPVPWPLATPPEGWLAYNGASFDKVLYPKLASIYPEGRLPDLRGEFIRGWDANRGVDSARKLLTFQNPTALTDYHGDGGASNPPRNYYTNQDSKYSAGEGFAAFGTINGNAGTAMVSAITSYITFRPRNVAFNYIVRAA